MNQLRHALAVIEDRTDDHAIDVETGMFGIRVVCKCGWEGRDHPPSVGRFPYGTSRELIEEAAAHTGVDDPPLWRRDGLSR